MGVEVVGVGLLFLERRVWDLEGKEFGIRTVIGYMF